MQFKVSTIAILITSLLGNTLAAPVPSALACAAHSDTALGRAIQSRSFEKMAAAVDGRDRAAIMLDLAGAIHDRSVDEVVSDVQVAMEGHVPSLEEQKKMAASLREGKGQLQKRYYRQLSDIQTSMSQVIACLQDNEDDLGNENKPYVQETERGWDFDAKRVEKRRGKGVVPV
ncbi:Hypothetical predicted protein [Lecanosticta acicola]|uniref:Uncharacterized protein n=1 Tax=Lecanosticta acicola TaxID=111012 RepID=A0AAI8YVB3_9PEZI|nr:Hypothetical predicted protein [Lecanosticta acicola]